MKLASQGNTVVKPLTKCASGPGSQTQIAYQATAFKGLLEQGGVQPLFQKNNMII